MPSQQRTFSSRSSSPHSPGMRGVQPHVGLRRIVRSYPSFLVRLYCVIRFRIMRLRFLEEIGQYLPRSGHVLEVGCGFGLFALYFASTNPEIDLTARDIDEHRIDIARRSQRQLGLRNVDFQVADARNGDLDGGPFEAVYMLDLLHHIPPGYADQLIHRIYEELRPGGVLLVKDVDVRPRYKMAFTWLLDVLMTGGERPDYWSSAELALLLSETGFKVFRHSMTDALPYPHQLFVAIKPDDAHRSS